jgi:tetratricopeptide (TPR) repeat protein
MGLPTEHIQSDQSHYETFLCKLCASLVDINAVVTSKCSHVYCRDCLEGWLTTSMQCPTCHSLLDGASFDEKKSSHQQIPFPNISNVCFLQVSQPLAHACMSRVKVCCPRCNSWKGEYEQLQGHLQSCRSGRETTSQDKCKKPNTRRSSSDSQELRKSGNIMGRRNSIEAISPLGIDPRKIDKRRTVALDEVFPNPSILNTLISRSIEGSSASQDDAQNLDNGNDGIPKPLNTKRVERKPSLSSQNSRSIIAEAGQLKEKGNSKFNKGEYKDARVFYDQAIGLVKDMKIVTSEDKHFVATLYCNRGAAYGKERHTDAALRDYDLAIRLVPDFAKAYTRKFKILSAKCRLAEAKDLLEVAVSKIPGDKSLNEELRNTKRILDGIENIKKMLQLNNYGEAKQVCDTLLTTTDNVEVILLSAEADASVGKIDSALEKCSFILKNDPANIPGLRTKGYITLVAGNLEQAITLFKEVMKLNGSNIEAKELCRISRKILSDVNEARSCVLNADGSRNSLKKAVELFSSAIEENSLPPSTPLVSILRTERAETELQLGHYPSALSDARAVIEANPVSYRAWIVKVDAYIALGRAFEGRKELQIVKQTWGREIPAIQAAYKRADFEAKIHDADKELRMMVSNGTKTSRVEENRVSVSDHRNITSPKNQDPHIKQVSRHPSVEVHDRAAAMGDKPVRQNSRTPARISGSGISMDRETKVHAHRRATLGSRDRIAVEQSGDKESFGFDRARSRERRSESKKRQQVKRLSIDEAELNRRMKVDAGKF